MKNWKFRKYLYWGVTAVIVIVLSAGFIIAMSRHSYVSSAVTLLCGVLAPVIYGAVMAYLLAPVYNKVRRGVETLMIKRGKGKDSRTVYFTSKTVATVVSLTVLLVVVTGLIAMLIPGLIDSILRIIENFPVYGINLQNWVLHILHNNPEIEEEILPYITQSSHDLQIWMQDKVVPQVYELVGRMSSGVINVIVVLKDLLIGLIVMVYLLNMKRRFLTQAKMILYSMFPVRTANKILEEGRYIHRVFGGFIIGKIVDSMIIGLMCFALLSIMNMPYVLLVSVIVGCTNVIPFFGPFIGAVPASLLILLVSPVKCLYFIVFILLLQMFDGYILGPRILGNSTGISSFWVLFSILLFGGIFGFVGMIIAVPTFAVIYRLFTEFVQWKLRSRQLSDNIKDYTHLDHIEQDTGTYVSNKTK